MDKNRSKGVTVSGILLITFSILALFACGIHYMFIHKAEAALGKEFSPTVKEQLKERGKGKELEEFMQTDKELREKVIFLKKDFKRMWTPSIIYNFVLLVTAISILRLKNWGRILAITFSILYLISGLFNIYYYFYRLTLNGALTCDIRAFYFSVAWIIYAVSYYIFCIFLLYFFTRPKVKEQFK